MTDLVERLRIKDATGVSISMLMEEAADEIEQLRAVLLASDAEIHRLNTDIVKRTRKAIEAADEIDRLRWAIAVGGEAGASAGKSE